MTSTISPIFTEREYAIAAHLAYIWGTKDSKRLSVSNQMMKQYRYSYQIIESLCNNDGTLITFRQGNKFIIACKGTHINSSTTMKDIVSDIAIAFRLTNFNSQFKNRTAKIKEFILKIQKMDNTAQISLCGHSLAGLIVHFAMTTDPFILENITKCYCFNPGSTPLYILQFMGEKKEEYMRKIQVLHIRGDKISEFGYKLYGTYRQFTLNEALYKRAAAIFIPLVAIGYLGPAYGLGTSFAYSWGKVGRYHSIANFFI